MDLAGIHHLTAVSARIRSIRCARRSRQRAATSGDVGQELGGAMAMPAGPDTYEELQPIVGTTPR